MAPKDCAFSRSASEICQKTYAQSGSRGRNTTFVLTSSLLLEKLDSKVSSDFDWDEIV